MKPIFAGVVLLVVALSAACAAAQDKKAADSTEMKHMAAPSSPEWQQLRSLVGDWQGTVEEGGKSHASTIEVRMTGGGSAIMHVIDKGGPYEMVTMFHPDGPTLMATHYCAARNQPRMQLVPAPGPNQVAFRFKDGTNIGPGDGHMVGLVITFIDANHHDEAWSYEDSGKEMPATVFHYTRKQ
ncbi:MAG TPA: hypothetical protein VN151_11815 [Terracidiphilus sp.]|nr:hypothetical protein [Terracidiphilus sp.]